jgi:hypothetical protein
VSTNGTSLPAFLAGVRAYLLTDAHVRHRTAEGHPGGEALPASLLEDRFYYFDEDACQAFFHAIEDMAMEEARGTLVALVPSFKEFSAHRERYEQIGVTIDRVAVAGSGRLPRPIHRVHLTEASRTMADNYRMISLHAGKLEVIFIARSAGGGSHQFVGFFSFNPRLTQRMRAALTNGLSAGNGELPEFERLLGVDQAAKQIEVDLNRQREAMDRAMLELREGGDSAHAGQVASELEMGAVRMSEWKNRVSAMMAQLQGR